MNKLFLLVALFMGAFAFSACSDDDDDKDNVELVGTWNIVKEYYLDKNGKLSGEEEKYEIGEWTFTFKADGTGEDREKDGEGFDKYPFNYTYSGGKLTIDWGEDEKSVFNVDIKDGLMVCIDTELDDEEERWVLELKK